MPKIELKLVQKELEKGVVWPLYWLYGSERLKSRELLARIRKAVLGKGSTSAWEEEVLDGHEVDVSQVLDVAKSLSLWGGIRLIVVQNAHALKNPELLAELLGPAKKSSELDWVCVCISKDLDGRKKFSKTLLEKAAVVPCEEVSENQKGAWIQFLAKRRGLELHSELVMKLSSIDPWTLDIIEQELEKYTLSDESSEIVQGDSSIQGGPDRFLESFFSREDRAALEQVSRFADSVDETLPLLGLLGWNLRQLLILLSDHQKGTRHSKINPYLAERFQRWSQFWTIPELVELQHRLSELDLSTKQTPLLPLGMWTGLVMSLRNEKN